MDTFSNVMKTNMVCVMIFALDACGQKRVKNLKRLIILVDF